MPPRRELLMFKLSDGVYDSVGVEGDAVGEVPHRRNSTGHINIDCRCSSLKESTKQYEKRGIPNTKKQFATQTPNQKNTSTPSCHSPPTTSTRWQFSVQSHRSLSTVNCLPPLENVYEKAVLNAEPQEPQYSELLPPLESVYETVGVAVEVPLHIYKSHVFMRHDVICSLHWTCTYFLYFQ